MSEQDLGAALGILLRSYANAVGPVLGALPHGARGYQTMCEVVRERQPSQAALAARLGIDRTAMTYLIDDLVSAGLVERRPNPDDRRQRRIVATDHGRDVLAALCEKVTTAEDVALGALSEAERAVFRRLLFTAAGAGAVHTPETCAMVEEALTP
ncbi:DNA-binding MarR family transcriptional regulator [Actinoplanes lutulentus]|uniref:DNA-binding MarR family transcriptional regulator n=1 Tax=Actinoplanes lutulentus TaxID=1287878 RepID=A0A327Z3F5_9ACTN|nr:MarR family transcriptional regulator [Actinoplanes lutulentus]MBB2948832.1 DNA-binding MarR family transcriptional regulator [Actinoplanes lutulentus]RAK29743.1 DNA-binding MarR family transcriptional regulator [Actinoplanes lutulentus]